MVKDRAASEVWVGGRVTLPVRGEMEQALVSARWDAMRESAEDVREVLEARQAAREWAAGASDQELYFETVTARQERGTRSLVVWLLWEAAFAERARRAGL